MSAFASFATILALVERGNGVLELGLHSWVCAGIKALRLRQCPIINALVQSRSGISLSIDEFVEQLMLVVLLEDGVCGSVGQIEGHVLSIATVLQIPLKVQRHGASL